MKERELIMENKKKHWFQNMLPWQKKRLYWSLFLFLLISISFLVYTVSSLYQDKVQKINIGINIYRLIQQLRKELINTAKMPPKLRLVPM